MSMTRLVLLLMIGCSACTMPALQRPLPRAATLVPEPVSGTPSTAVSANQSGPNEAWYARIRDAGYPNVAQIVRYQDEIGCTPHFTTSSGTVVRVVFPPGQGNCTWHVEKSYKAECPLGVAFAESRGHKGTRDLWHPACYVPRYAVAPEVPDRHR